MARFPIKRLKDGRAMLNLACGGRMHPEWNNIDFSLLVRLAKHRRLAWLLHGMCVLSDRRYERLLGSDPDIVCWDLRKGIPFPDNTFDVVYHSHFLEHLAQDAARGFLRECHRVLKASGVMRVILPDFSQFCRDYLSSYELLERFPRPSGPQTESHDRTLSALLGQFVVGEPRGTAEQRFPVRVLERLIRGNNVRAGEAHRWMYDRFTLRRVLEDLGFTDIRFESASTARIARWSEFNLDTNGDGSPYKPSSLYTEALKPHALPGAVTSGC